MFYTNFYSGRYVTVKNTNGPLDGRSGKICGVVTPGLIYIVDFGPGVLSSINPYDPNRHNDYCASIPVMCME